MRVAKEGASDEQVGAAFHKLLLIAVKAVPGAKGGETGSGEGDEGGGAGGHAPPPAEGGLVEHSSNASYDVEKHLLDVAAEGKRARGENERKRLTAIISKCRADALCYHNANGTPLDKPDDVFEAEMLLQKLDEEEAAARGPAAGSPTVAVGGPAAAGKSTAKPPRQAARQATANESLVKFLNSNGDSPADDELLRHQIEGAKLDNEIKASTLKRMHEGGRERDEKRALIQAMVSATLQNATTLSVLPEPPAFRPACACPPAR